MKQRIQDTFCWFSVLCMLDLFLFLTSHLIISWRQYGVSGKCTCPECLYGVIYQHVSLPSAAFFLFMTLNFWGFFIADPSYILAHQLPTTTSTELQDWLILNEKVKKYIILISFFFTYHKLPLYCFRLKMSFVFVCKADFIAQTSSTLLQY